VPEEERDSSLSLIERRRVAPRISVNTPIEVTAKDKAGHPVTERTIMEDVSDFGCRFVTHVPVKQGDTVSVKVLGTDGNTARGEVPRLFEIIWVAPKERHSTVGARLLPDEELTKMKIPQENGGGKQGSK
jgi:hypothetical protein